MTEVTVTIVVAIILILTGVIGYLLTQKDKNIDNNFNDLYDRMELLTEKIDHKYEGFVRATTTGFSELKDVMNDLVNKTSVDRQKLEAYNKNCDLMSNMVRKRLDAHERQLKAIKKIVDTHEVIIKKNKEELK
jgi:hypothetical protein